MIGMMIDTSMKHKFENPRVYNTCRSLTTGGKVTLIRRWCKVCGHTINFLSRHPIICRNCGNWVYPDDKYEFVEKMKKELKK